MEQNPFWEDNRSSATQAISAFYGTWKFITALKTARHLSLNVDNLIMRASDAWRRAERV
jgi:hypothetical protein